MKVLILSHSDVMGGAARAAFRLHKGLLTIGVDSQMLVAVKGSDDPRVMSTTTGLLYRIFVSLKFRSEKLYASLFGANAHFSVARMRNRKTVKLINQINPDVVHLHWVNGGMLAIEDIRKIRPKIVWSMHDNWLITGGCHVHHGCMRYVNDCGKCPVLDSSKEHDISRRVLIRKKHVFSSLDKITVVALSKWMYRISTKSPLLKNHDLKQLPNPIDSDVFTITDKETGRKRFNLPQNKKLILFGAVNATSDINKGYTQLVSALEEVKSEAELVVFGSDGSGEDSLMTFKTYFTGYLDNDHDLISLYNAADLMVVPSLQENLSNAIMEALSCGTPVVAFNIGGNSDMIDHQSNGYLAETKESKDLANGIDWVLNHPDYDSLSQYCREKVLKNFSEKVVAQKYSELYSELI